MHERSRILELLAEGKINVAEAERLLDAVKREEQQAARAPGPPAPPQHVAGTPPPAATPRFLRVLVNKKDGECVNVRVPLGLLKAGLKLKGLLPESAKADVDMAMKEKGLQFKLDDLDGKSLDEIVQTLREFSVDVDGGDETVRIFCE